MFHPPQKQHRAFLTLRQIVYPQCLAVLDLILRPAVWIPSRHPQWLWKPSMRPTENATLFQGMTKPSSRLHSWIALWVYSVPWFGKSPSNTSKTCFPREHLHFVQRCSHGFYHGFPMTGAAALTPRRRDQHFSGAAAARLGTVKRGGGLRG